MGFATIPPLRGPAHARQVRRKKPGLSGRDDNVRGETGATERTWN